ncbi:hypothetical protein ACEPPN_017605 [Leptodophora sp. 'Broadleaf-Isolate-01']
MESNAGPSTDPLTNEAKANDNTESHSLGDDMLPMLENLVTEDLEEVVDQKQILDAFKAQRDPQQKQFALLESLANNQEETQNVVPETTEVNDVPPPNWKLMFKEDYYRYHRRALEWDKKQRPDSRDLEDLPFTFPSYCRSIRSLWFSDASLNETSRARLENVLREKWPQSLGSITGETNQNNLWDFEDPDQKMDPVSHLTISMTRYEYEYEYTDGFGGGEVKAISRPPIHVRSLEGWNTLAVKRPTKPVPWGTLIVLNPDISYHCLTLKCIAFLILHLDTTTQEHDSHLALIKYYLHPWGTEKKPWRSPPYDCQFGQTFGIRFFARVTSQDTPKEAGTTANVSNGTERNIDTRLPAIREHGQLSETVNLAEKRVLMRLKSQFDSETPCFNIVQIGRGNASQETPDGAQEKTKFRGGQFAGMHTFLALLAAELVDVCHQWGRVLDGMDEKLGATVTNLLDEKTGHELMFDDNEFKRSKLYFTIQQLCRMFKRYVEETQSDLEDLREGFFKQWDKEKNDFEMRDDLRYLEHYWTEVMVEPKIKLESILTRIKNKQEDVESLRDGLFNATSVREASRGLEINQYLFVFTIMTVIYLPLSFVTSIFGMHLFDTTDSGVVAARPKFYVTLVVLSVATYIAAGLAFWLVRNNKKKGSGERAMPKMKKVNHDVDPDGEVNERDGKTEGGMFASMRRRGKGNGKGKGKEVSATVEDV